MQKAERGSCYKPQFSSAYATDTFLSQCFEWHRNFENSPQLPSSVWLLAEPEHVRASTGVTFPSPRQTWPGRAAQLPGRAHSWQLLAKKSAPFREAWGSGTAPSPGTLRWVARMAPTQFL